MQVPVPPSAQLRAQGLEAFVQSMTHSEPVLHVMIQLPPGQITLQDEPSSQVVLQPPLVQSILHVAPKVQLKRQMLVPHEAEHSVAMHLAMLQPVWPHSNVQGSESHWQLAGQSTDPLDPPLLLVPVLPPDEEASDTVGGE